MICREVKYSDDHKVIEWNGISDDLECLAIMPPGDDRIKYWNHLFDENLKFDIYHPYTFTVEV